MCLKYRSGIVSSEAPMIGQWTLILMIQGLLEGLDPYVEDIDSRTI